MTTIFGRAAAVKPAGESCAAPRVAIAAAVGGVGVPEAAGGAGGMPAPHSIVRTTAEPRPNAYIPDDIGIPKPYGALQPFKPTEQGTSMRHIRKPQPREIEL